MNKSNVPYGTITLAGVIGGILVDTFLSIVMQKSPVAIWQFVASTLVGPSAFASPAFALLGFAMHFVISIVWAFIYVYVFGALGQLRNWILGAVVWGIVVDAAMQGLLAIKLGAPFVSSFTQGLVPHIVFYALPVAALIAWRARSVPQAA